MSWGIKTDFATSDCSSYFWLNHQKEGITLVVLTVAWLESFLVFLLSWVSIRRKIMNLLDRNVFGA